MAMELAKHGLDLTATTQVGLYNQRVSAPHRLEQLTAPTDSALVIGNTRALWARFVEYLRGHPEWLNRSDPLDDYVEWAIHEVARSLGSHIVRFAHRPQPEHIAFLELAHAAGLAFRSSGNLCIHPTYGPWIALRAVIVVPKPGPSTAPLDSPCTACDDGCARQLKTALGTLGADLPNHEDLKERWRLFLAVRDACPLGGAHRYSDAQIRYHYTKDRAALEEAVYSASSTSS